MLIDVLDGFCVYLYFHFHHLFIYFCFSFSFPYILFFFSITPFLIVATFLLSHYLFIYIFIFVFLFFSPFLLSSFLFHQPFHNCCYLPSSLLPFFFLSLLSISFSSFLLFSLPLRSSHPPFPSQPFFPFVLSSGV